ncbi:transposase, partial [Acinetobacter defluvii]|uniref:IS701 family transposase n=1 Tax=Acinetobacter defluvii TaxID=1871111 RepID=UPI003AF84522
MIRQTKHASTAHCTLPIYMGFLMTEPHSISCTQLAETYQISHDSVNRFLERENYCPQGLYTEAIQSIDNHHLIGSVDDTVLDKPYSQHMDLVGFFWSGKHHRSVKGINLITLYATDQHGKNVPINFRLYDHSENKTKNDYFMDMLNEVLLWGADIDCVTGDSWYAATSNLKAIRNHGIRFMFGIDKNRKVSFEKGIWHQIQKLPDFENGQKVWLKDFGFV